MMKFVVMLLVGSSCISMYGMMSCRTLKELAARPVAMRYVAKCLSAKQCIPLDNLGQEVANAVKSAVRITYGWNLMVPRLLEEDYDKKIAAQYFEQIRTRRSKLTPPFVVSFRVLDKFNSKVLVSWSKRYLAFLDDVDNFCFFDRQASSFLHPLCWHEHKEIVNGCFSSDCCMCVTVDSLSWIHLFDVPSSVLLRAFQVAHACDAVFSEDGLYLEVLRKNETPLIFQVADFDSLMAKIIST